MPSARPNEISYADCLAAARAARGAEHGRQAYDTARPRGTIGLIRSRGPLPVMLYVASREGRLVWRDRAGFALLEPPVAGPPRRPGGGLRLGLLRLVDRRWETLLFAGPPVLALAAAMACLLFRPLWLVAVVLALAAVLYVLVPMVATVFTALVWLYRTFGRRRARPGEEAAESLPGYHWAMRLCHSADPAGADDLLQRASRTLHLLVEAGVVSAAAERGGRPRGVDIFEVLVCLTRGATTSAMRSHLARTDRVDRPYGGDGDVVLLRSSDRPTSSRERMVSTAGFFFWYVFGGALVIAMCAWIVADRERSACGTACAGRPATYEEALRWLLGVADHLQPDAPGTWVMGMLAGVVRWMTVPVAMVAIWQKWRVMRLDREKYAEHVERIVRRPRVLLLVVTDVEFQAVLTMAGRANPGLTVWPDHHGGQTVFQLGVLGDCEVMLARSGPGPTSPRGLLLTTEELIRELRPEYALLTGICFGLREDEQRLGDVVVASQVRDLDHRKLSEGEDGVVEQQRGERLGPSAMLFGSVVSVASSWRNPSAQVGPMVASGTLFNSPTRRTELKAQHPDAVAGDMESHVFSAAAHRHRTQWCVVRGISDWGMDKTDNDQRYAAENAARLVLEVISSGALRRLAYTEA